RRRQQLALGLGIQPWRRPRSRQRPWQYLRRVSMEPVERHQYEPVARSARRRHQLLLRSAIRRDATHSRGGLTFCRPRVVFSQKQSTVHPPKGIWSAKLRLDWVSVTTRLNGAARRPCSVLDVATPRHGSRGLGGGMRIRSTPIVVGALLVAGTA